MRLTLGPQGGGDGCEYLGRDQVLGLGIVLPTNRGTGQGDSDAPGAPVADYGCAEGLLRTMLVGVVTTDAKSLRLAGTTRVVLSLASLPN